MNVKILPFRLLLFSLNLMSCSKKIRIKLLLLLIFKRVKYIKLI
jgi:hypothetical protein